MQLVYGVNRGLALSPTTVEPWMDIVISYTRSPQLMGMETNTDLLARLTFDEVGYTDTMSHSNMSPKPTTQLSTKVTDWVERQALEDREPNATDGANTGAKTTIKHSLEPYTRPRRYDIVTLLQLRYTADLTKVELRVHPSALQEQIFKPAPCALYARTQKRSRGVSDVSLNSLQSIPSDEEVIYRKSRPSRMPFAPPLSFQEALQLNFVNRFPRRQPRSPPVNSLAQQHDGFARFLKEHASPPHQRVTAGGRIVPASGPPPVFNVDSLRTPTSGSLAPEPLAVSQQNRNGQAEEEKVRESAPLALKVAQFNTNKSLTPENRQASQPQRPTASVEAIGSSIIRANDQVQPRVYSTPQASAQNTPMMLADGSHVVVQNGIPYRVYWNGFQTVAEPAIFPFAAVPGSGSMSLQSMTVGPQYSIANPYANTSNLPIALTSSTNGQDVSLPQVHQQTPDHVLERLQESLRYELKKLDKHIALRSQTFSALEHASYVAQRKHLVEQMDNIRVSRGGRGGRSSSSSTITNQGNFHKTSHVLTSHSVTQPGRPQNISNTDEAKNLTQLAKFDTHGISTGPPWYDLVNGTMDTAPTPRSIVRSQQETPPARKGLGASSILSPDAPPFVPSSMQGNAARKVEICLPHHQRGNGLLNAVAESSSVKAPSLDYGQPLEGSTALKGTTIPNAGKDEQTKQHLPPGGSRAVGKFGMPGSGSALDDVVPIVHQADIAYVDSLGLNPIQEPKLYCSNVTEFQEVIRRVREQARLYGCEGGQSKDPEFDAEQDIRWAMADSSPVPLPKKVPDHIVHPRPWNWNDSVFNVRADRSHLRSKTSLALPSQMGNDRFQACKMDNETGPKSVSSYQNTNEGKAPETVNIKDIMSASRNIEVSKAAERDVKIQDLNKRQPSGLTVLEHRSPNSAVTTTRAENLAVNGSVDKSEPCPEKAVRHDEVAWQELLMKHDAQTALEKKGPVTSQVEANMEGIETSKRRQHQAYIEDNTEPLSTSVRVVSSAESNKQGSIFFGIQGPKQEKSTKEWTKEDQAAVDAAYGDPFKRPPTPECWKEVPLPPEILSKVPFKMEDLRKGPQRVPYVHVPGKQYYSATNAVANDTAVHTSSHRPLGYNEYKPVSIPTGATSAAGAPSFLRDMLKSPRYSTASYGQLTPPRVKMGRQVSFAEAARQPSNKENYRSSTKLSNQANHMGGHRTNTSNTYHSSQDARLNKAQSSIASSSHYAQGYLPQYPGPGNPQSSEYYIRYHSPQSQAGMQGGFSGPSQAGHASYASRRYPPQYDGGADSPPHHTKTRPDEPNGIEGRKPVDVSPQDFQVDDRKLPSGHSYAVDRLFQSIRDAERKGNWGNDQKDVRATK